MLPMTVPISLDDTISVKGYRDGRGVRVCFSEGRFINIGLFRLAFHKVASGEQVKNGPVTIKVTEIGDGVLMEVTIEGADKPVHRKLTPDVCDEINDWLTWAESGLAIYRLRDALRQQDQYPTDINAPIKDDTAATPPGVPDSGC